MATVLNDYTMRDMELYYITHGTAVTYFCLNEEANNGWMQQLRSRSNSEDNEPLEWVAMMLKDAQQDRPTASQVLAKIADSCSGHRFFCFQCLENERDGDFHNDQHGNASSSELVTGSLLQSYLQRNLTQKVGGTPRNQGDQTDDEEDTVTSKMLEDAGAVKVLSDESPSTFEDVETEAEDDERKKETDQNSEDSSHASIHESMRGTSESEKQSLGPKASASSSDKSADDEMTRVQSNLAELPPSVSPSFKSEKIKSEQRRSRAKHVTFGESSEANQEPSHYSKRFTGLHEDRRPAASEPIKESGDVDNTPIVPPEPLIPPPLDEKDCYPLPKATLVPSYILAGANRFTMSEVRASDPTMGSFNLFVYGRLMFPSVLRAFAANSIQGIYSPLHQRRLIPSSNDWARIDVSIKHAAEAMTPARLKDFNAWRPSRMECAVLQDDSWTRRIINNRVERNLAPLEPAPLGEVTGFLILGVTEEALRYCDLMFTSDMEYLKRAKVVSNEGEPRPTVDCLLERRMISVDVQLTSGHYRSVPACTYVWTQGADHLWHAWRPEYFIRGSQFQDLSYVESHDWRAEEMSMAETMHIAYALIGDELCSAIVSDNFSKLKHLLGNDNDPNARCRKFGTPLQAAVATDNEDMVRLLLQYGANPSAKGGKYGTPLIAATIGSRKSITRLLLKQRADVFASNTQYVNALYQAVGHGDWAIAQMLLEAGAWLSRDYSEIKDLAIERRDRDLQALLLEYDVREPNIGRLRNGRSHDETMEKDHNEDQSLLKTSSRVLKFVLRKFIVLNGQSGSWRGRKGVTMTRAALRAGAPPVILDYIRDAINPIQKLIDVLKAADKAQEEEHERILEAEGRVEEIDSDEDEGEKEEPESPSIKVTEPDYEYIVASSPQILPVRSRNSSTGSVGSAHLYDPKDQPYIEGSGVDDKDIVYEADSSPHRTPRSSRQSSPLPRNGRNRPCSRDSAQPLIGRRLDEPRVSTPTTGCNYDPNPASLAEAPRSPQFLVSKAYSTALTYNLTTSRLHHPLAVPVPAPLTTRTPTVHRSHAKAHTDPTAWTIGTMVLWYSHHRYGVGIPSVGVECIHRMMSPEATSIVTT